jgi:hypothetical protein
MAKQLYRYTFTPRAPIEEVEASLLLALLATESLHGESRVRLEAAHAWDSEGRSCVIDAGGEVGDDLNRLFVGFIRREFGEDAFQVERVQQPPRRESETVSASASDLGHSGCSHDGRTS